MDREIVLKILLEIEEKNAYSNIVLDEYLERYREKLSSKDVGFISELVYGIVTWKLTIDVIIQKYSNVKLNKISKVVLNILRLGVYQIVFLDKVPKSAAVNECVKLTKKYVYKSCGFVNAVLRKVSKQDYEELCLIKDSEERISKQYSMPIWMVRKFVEEYDIEKAEEIARCSNIRPKVTIRINNWKLEKENKSKEWLLSELEKRKIEYQNEKSNFLYLNNVKNLSKIDLFEQGYFTVQDDGAGKIVELLEPESGDVILDACAAPGGKTTYIAEIMKNIGKIVAWDIHEHRVRLINQNAKRLGISIIKAEVKDASRFEEEYFEKFDKILLDVPCLGLGVMKRKPDIKWQRNKEELEKISKIQLDILQNCNKYLKPNGILVYSTCSLLKEENENIINEFMKAESYEILRSTTIMVTEKNDGFFLCNMRKK